MRSQKTAKIKREDIDRDHPIIRMFKDSCSIGLLGSKTACAVMLAIGLLGTASPMAEGSPQDFADVRAFITLLDSNDFQKRQSAIRNIASAGGQAVEVLARELGNCSPEACTGIKKALQRIAEDCDEEHLFKILSILKSRFDIPDEQIQPLLMKWAVAGRKSVVERWRSMGAVVSDPHEQMVEEDLVRAGVLVPNFQQFGGNGIAAFRRRPIVEFQVVTPQDLGKPDPEAPAATDSDPPVPPPEPVDYQQLIEDALQNSLEQNMEFVLGDREQGQRFKNSLQLVRSLPVEVSLGDSWKGEAKDFEQGSDVKALPISKLRLDSVNLTSKWADVLKLHPLESIAVNRCSIDQNLKNDRAFLPKSVTELTVAGVAETGKLIRRLVGENSKVYRLSLSGGELDQELFRSLQGTGLMVLELEGLELSEAQFDRLAALPKLRQITLNRCRFDADEYRDFESSLQGRVRLDFTAKAFLGVRGNTAPIVFGPRLELKDVNGERMEDAGPGVDNARRPRGSDCVITEVVPGSAADNAGVRAGDVIIAIGEQRVVDFADLRVLIAQYGIGDEVAIRVRRDEKTLDLKTKLGDFRDSQ